MAVNNLPHTFWDTLHARTFRHIIHLLRLVEWLVPANSSESGWVLLFLSWLVLEPGFWYLIHPAPHHHHLLHSDRSPVSALVRLVRLLAVLGLSPFSSVTGMWRCCSCCEFICLLLAVDDDGNGAAMMNALTFDTNVSPGRWIGIIVCCCLLSLLRNIVGQSFDMYVFVQDVLQPTRIGSR